MDGYQVTKIVGAARSPSGNLVVIIENKAGERRALELADEQIDDLVKLIDQARSRSRLRDLADPEPASRIAIDPGLEDRVTTRRIVLEVRQPVGPQSLSTHGTFALRIEDGSGKGVTLVMPHEEAMRWRDTMSEHIEAFAKRSN